jgi:hypothetical protein
MKPVLSFVMLCMAVAGSTASAALENPAAGSDKGGTADGVEFAVKANLTRTDVADRVRVLVSPPRWSLHLPSGARLEYSVLHDVNNVSFGASVDLFTETGAMRNNPDIKDQNGVAAGAVLRQQASGRWYSRNISLEKLAGQTVFQVSVDASYAVVISKSGPNQVRVRGLRIVDAAGQPLWEFKPDPAAVGWPLPVIEGFTPDLHLEAPALVAGNFLPEKYLAVENESLAGAIEIHNFDPSTARQIDYAFNLVAIEASNGGDADESQKSEKIAAPEHSGSVLVQPSQTVRIPVVLPALVAAHYRPLLRLRESGREGTSRGDAISVLSRAAYDSRPAPLASGGFGMGAVPLSGGGSALSLPTLREQGGNYFQLRLDWSMIEPRPGEYDVERPARYIEMAKACGIKLQIDFYSGYPSHTVPSWYRNQQMETNAGERAGGQFVPIGYFTEAREAGLRAFQALLNRWGHDDTVIAWNAWIAGNMDAFYALKHRREREQLMDYSQPALERFRTWLRDERGLSLADLGRRYGRDGASFPDWSAITFPQPFTDRVDLRPEWADFMDFRLWAVGHVEAEAAGILKKAIPPSAHIEFLYGGSLDGIQIGNDFDEGVLNARRFGGSLHQTSSPNPLTQGYLGGARRHFGVPFTIETAGTPATVPVHQHAMFELMSQGAAAFTWIQSGGVSTLPTPLHGFGELRPALERLAGSKEAEPKVSLLYGYSSRLVDIFGKQLDTHRLADELATRFERAGYAFNVFTDRTSDVRWQELPVVVDSFSEALDARVVNSLTEYVRGGGKLVLFTSSGRLTPGSGDAGSRFNLLRALGVEVDEQPKGIRVGVPQARFGGPHAEGLDGLVAELRHHRGIHTLPAAAAVWAKDAAGRPAVASWSLGKGEVLLWAGWPDAMAAGTTGGTTTRYSQNPASVYPSVFDAALERFAGITTDVRCQTPNVLWSLRRKGESTFLILFNQQATPVQARFDWRASATAGWKHAVDLVNEASVAPPVVDGHVARFSQTLQPYEVTVVEFSPQPVAVPPRDFPRRIRAISPAKNPVVAAAMARGALQDVTGVFMGPVMENPGRFPGENYAVESAEVTKILAAGSDAAINYGWKLVEGDAGFFDLKRLTGKSSGVAYLAWEIESPETAERLLVFGADYGLKLWVNGVPCFDSVKDHSGRGAPQPDEFMLPLPLKKGRNVIVAKIAAGTGGWGLWLKQIAPGTLR